MFTLFLCVHVRRRERPKIRAYDESRVDWHSQWRERQRERERERELKEGKEFWNDLYCMAFRPRHVLRESGS